MERAGEGDHGRHPDTEAIEGEAVRTGATRACRGWWRHLVVEAAVLVIGDDEEGFFPFSVPAARHCRIGR
jgi:hypothetical protein